MDLPWSRFMKGLTRHQDHRDVSLPRHVSNPLWSRMVMNSFHDPRALPHCHDKPPYHYWCCQTGCNLQ